MDWNRIYKIDIFEMTPWRSCEILGSRNVKKRKLFHLETVLPFRLRMKKCSVSGTGNLGQVTKVRISAVRANLVHDRLVWRSDRSLGENVIDRIVQGWISRMINCSIYRAQCTIKWTSSIDRIIHLSIERVRFFIDCSKTWIRTAFWLAQRVFVFFLVQRETQISNFKRFWLELTTGCFQLIAQIFTFSLNNK